MRSVEIASKPSSFTNSCLWFLSHLGAQYLLSILLSVQDEDTENYLVDGIPVQFIPGDSSELPTFEEAIPDEITAALGVEGLPMYAHGDLKSARL